MSPHWKKKNRLAILKSKYNETCSQLSIGGELGQVTPRLACALLWAYRDCPVERERIRGALPVRKTASPVYAGLGSTMLVDPGLEDDTASAGLKKLADLSDRGVSVVYQSMLNSKQWWRDAGAIALCFVGARDRVRSLQEEKRQVAAGGRRGRGGAADGTAQARTRGASAGGRLGGQARARRLFFFVFLPTRRRAREWRGIHHARTPARRLQGRLYSLVSRSEKSTGANLGTTTPKRGHSAGVRRRGS